MVHRSTGLRRGISLRRFSQRGLRRSTDTPLCPTWWTEIGRRPDCGQPGWTGASPGPGRAVRPYLELNVPVPALDVIGRAGSSGGVRRSVAAQREEGGDVVPAQDCVFSSGDTASAARHGTDQPCQSDTSRSDTWWCLCA